MHWWEVSISDAVLSLLPNSPIFLKGISVSSREDSNCICFYYIFPISEFIVVVNCNNLWTTNTNTDIDATTSFHATSLHVSCIIHHCAQFLAAEQPDMTTYARPRGSSCSQREWLGRLRNWNFSLYFLESKRLHVHAFI